MIPSVTENITELVRQWQMRPLDVVYPIVYLDALRVKIRVDGVVQNRCIYLAIGANPEGKKETLGLWTAETECAKFWLSVLTEINNRGVKDIFIACVDGLNGFTEAIEPVFPETITQVCIVHQIRNSLTYISYKDRKAVAADLKPIYTAPTEDEVLFALEEFAEKWNSKYIVARFSQPMTMSLRKCAFACRNLSTSFLRSPASIRMRFQPPGGGRIGQKSQHSNPAPRRVSRCCGNGGSVPEPVHRGLCRSDPAREL